MVAKKYDVYWTNFGYYSHHSFSSIEKALDYIRNICFSGSVIDSDQNIVATWDSLNGTTYNTTSCFDK
jgi:hypothetical protein